MTNTSMLYWNRIRSLYLVSPQYYSKYIQYSNNVWYLMILMYILFTITPFSVKMCDRMGVGLYTVSRWSV